MKTCRSFPRECSPIGIGSFPDFGVHFIASDNDSVLERQRRYCPSAASSSSSNAVSVISDAATGFGAGAFQRRLARVDVSVAAFTSGITADFEIQILLVHAADARIFVLSVGGKGMFNGQAKAKCI